MSILRLMQCSLKAKLFTWTGLMLLVMTVLATSAILSLQHTRSALHGYLAQADLPAARANWLRMVRDVDRSFTQTLAAPFGLQAERDHVRAAKEAWQRAAVIGNGIFLGGMAGPAVAKDLIQLDSALGESVAHLNIVTRLARSEMNKELVSTASVISRTRTVVLSSLLVGMGFGLGACLAFSRSTLPALGLLRTGAERLREGDFTYQVPLLTTDELGDLTRIFNDMANKFGTTLAECRAVSIHDYLTGLYSRGEFERQLKEEMERSKRYGHVCSVLMVDIDHFKTVNDTYGHPAGDEALRTIAARLGREVRPVDMVARYGGEEFIILLPETMGPSAVLMAERLREAVAAHAVIMGEEHSVRLTVSIGVASMEEGLGTVGALENAADQALYAAKEGGRNCVRRFIMP